MKRFAVWAASVAVGLGAAAPAFAADKPAAEPKAAAGAGKPVSLALQGPRKAVQLLFNDDVLDALVLGSGYKSTVTADAAGVKTFTIPLRMEGYTFAVDASTAGTEDEMVVILTTAVGRPLSRSALAVGMATKADPGRFLYSQGGVLYLSLSMDARTLYAGVEDIRRQVADLKRQLDKEMDEGRKKELTRQIFAEELRAMSDIRVRLKEDEFKSKIAAIQEIIGRNPEFFDAAKWQRATPQTTVGRVEPDAGERQGREYVRSLSMDYPYREGSSYHHFLQREWRPDYLGGNVRDYDRTIGQTEQWRAHIPTNTGQKIEPNGDEVRLTEASSLQVQLWRKTYLAQTNYDYDRTIADKSKYRGSIPAQAPVHYYHTLETNLPVKHFDNDLRKLPLQYYTGTAGPYRDARDYDAKQKRPYWVGY